MKLLLDTHTFLWFIGDNPKLSAAAKKLLESDVELMISAASLWEIAIKVSIGKLTLTQPFQEFIPDQLTKNSVQLLPIGVAHLATVSTLPFHHRDPFDRLIAAQAIIEQLPIVSVDDKFDLYGVNRLW
jgi:PIN domain nuclease of toxin-antitoxin system